ncbi:MAG: helix-turn-helix domain-containing protein [Clostridia bacterium]|nr:helix-turn-helix domain-containing protein [Clostridia bacterium]
METINSEKTKIYNKDTISMFSSYPDIVDIKQLADMLGIGITLAYRLVKQNKIRTIKIGRAYKIPKVNVISYLID